MERTEIIEKAVTWALQVAQDPAHGYDQMKRSDDIGMAASGRTGQDSRSNLHRKHGSCLPPLRF